MEQLELNFREDIRVQVNLVKGNWILLGNMLAKVKKEKLFFDYGFESFEAYCIGDINMLPTVCNNLIKNVYFVANEKPYLLGEDAGKQYKLPTADHVALIRNAKKSIGKNISSDMYNTLEEAVFDEVEPVKKVKSMLKGMKEAYEDKSEEEKALEKTKKDWNKQLGSLEELSLLFNEASKKLEKKELEDIALVLEDIKASVIEEINNLN